MGWIVFLIITVIVVVGIVLYLGRPQYDPEMKKISDEFDRKVKKMREEGHDPFE